ncbi:hypothetical protein H3146_05905 [Streptomyces sp. OF3]|uniref:Uncharacterized protein n=1 Tax=Streptomyces alkaliterrae TaxID=2213162 RepID=A0A7W3WIC4_9ACTN|nr:hypothetical protein [Streptomyces alkaliterrae]MBB1252901.1 hypothetical protein [Streptomyces alkaliterrae]
MTDLTDAERTMLAYALDQAQERIWAEDGFTDEDQAAVDSLRRLVNEPGRHVYLSTGCLHGRHDYCQAMTGANGQKRPGQCKFADEHGCTPCVCPCHQPGAEPDTGPS